MSKVVCEISCWRFHRGLCSTVGRPVEIDSDHTGTLVENNKRYTMWEIADILKYPNQ